jgi:hypothetical protein
MLSRLSPVAARHARTVTVVLANRLYSTVPQITTHYTVHPRDKVRLLDGDEHITQWRVFFMNLG